jgi:hypothetical protein
MKSRADRTTPATAPHIPVYLAQKMQLLIPCALVLALTCAPRFASAAMPKHMTVSKGDADVLRYALALEHIEAAFYNWVVGSNLFTAFPVAAQQYVPLIQAHENAHVKVLTGVLGPQAGVACTNYPFEQLVTDYASFLSLALTFENLGVSAYDFAIQVRALSWARIRC